MNYILSGINLEFIDLCQKSNDLETIKRFYNTHHSEIDDEYGFEKICENGNLEIAKWLYSFGGIDIHMDNDFPFRFACKYGHSEIVKWLHSLGGIDIHMDDDFPYRYACQEGYTELAQWIHSMGNINISQKDYDIFCYVCQEGHLEMAQWIYSMGNIDVEERDSLCFRGVSWTGKIEIIKWLSSLCQNYKYIENEEQIICIEVNTLDYYIYHKGNKRLIGTFKMTPFTNIELEVCNICYNDANILTNCGHSYCIECLMKWYYRSKNCAYCRQKITVQECKANED